MAAEHSMLAKKDMDCADDNSNYLVKHYQCNLNSLNILIPTHVESIEAKNICEILHLKCI